MIPSLLVQLSFLVIGIRCAVRFFKLISHRSRNWMEILFYAAVVIVSLSFLI